ncbi:MAG: discoidin domain-containing protein [Spirochaetes bacterium]|nr:discoidin domain-containing protein [Spirochaetota bacterium]
MSTVNILYPVRYTGKIHAFSSSFEKNEAENVLKNDATYWCTAKNHNAVSEYITIDYGSMVAANIIEIFPSPSGKTTFPSEFRLECSADGINWEVIKAENRYTLEDDAYRLFLPIKVFRFLKLYIAKPKRIAAKYFSEIGSIQAGLQGAVSITASSSSSYEHDPSCLIDSDTQKYWESEITQSASRQWIEVDLGRMFPLIHIGIIATGNPTLFPEQFSIEISDDKKIWSTLADVKRFKAEPKGSYIFGGYQFNARYIRINVMTVQTDKQKYCAQIAGITANAPLPAVQHFHINAGVQYATVFQPGIVKLAADGDTTPGTVVQAHDTRLRDASTIFKGIVQLAEDGSSEKGLAVQASDSRLALATELKAGIVRLAYDREVSEGAVVQSTDSRIKEATETTFGIVKLCPDGQYSSNSVVRGDDSRLHKATTRKYGIVRLAENGEDNEFCVVQGNDRRLKDATIVSKGIVELAEDGEDAPNVVVQGNDRRLKEATTHSKGIVELAEDGEDAPGVVVQGNDRRLKEATEETPGIVTLAKHGQSRKFHVVQSDDPRLSDKREPLPHTHDYAPLVHSFDSHTGTIAIIQEKSGELIGITPPTSDSAILYGKNTAHTGTTIGVAGIAFTAPDSDARSYGVVGHAPLCGVRGQSQGNSDTMQGSGVMGVSRFGAGGVFVSEHNWSLVADGFGAIAHYDDTLQLVGDGRALYVNGQAYFKGTITIDTDAKEYYANIVEMFETDEKEFISPGDVLVVSTQGNSILSRSRTAYNKGVIGVVAGNPVVVINNASAEKKLYPVVLTGSVLCKVDARQKPVKPGDLLVTSDTPGCGMAASIDSFDKIGTVFAKALTALDDGIALIPVMIWKM